MTAVRPDTPVNLDKALYRVSEAMELLSLSRSVVYELIRSGRLRTVKEGRSRLVPASAIAEYVELLEREAQGEVA
ncbi:helix-turn-helix domain-containing protein [Actinomadura sp. NBRC 104425]|uniref:helix-turn-helix domain-containing protein n=1 Tax=Actinomadura sp. NBRC 104425 TaxID=3032204 RepID=UPI002553CAFA|nr:helix-turn-helix domain-containing protein [Actinomadura sp. NBRC 104425]